MTTRKTADLEDRMAGVVAAAQEWTTENSERCLALHVAHNGQVVLAQGFGNVRPLANAETTVAAQPNTIFLVASLTKPLTAAAVCLLADRGLLSLDDPVIAYIPAFRGHDRDKVLVRHLLTHTSGLPDMLPENVALRQAHASLDVFVERTCTTPLLFEPGSDCRYQSMGILLAGRIVEVVTGMPLRLFLAQEFFRPLAMADTWLGLGALDRRRVARVILSPEDASTSWNWNSPYWRDLGAPWGGLHTTAGDYARFLQLMLDHGKAGGQTILRAEMVREMLTDQISAMPGLAAQVKEAQAWGLGWRLNRPRGASGFPQCGPETIFGHGGATGTVAWADPTTGLVCVILTNDPESGAFRKRISDMVAGCT